MCQELKRRTEPLIPVQRILTSQFHKLENARNVILAATKMGCVIENIGAPDIVDGKTSLIMGNLIVRIDR